MADDAGGAANGSGASRDALALSDGFVEPLGRRQPRVDGHHVAPRRGGRQGGRRGARSLGRDGRRAGRRPRRDGRRARGRSARPHPSGRGRQRRTTRGRFADDGGEIGELARRAPLVQPLLPDERLFGDRAEGRLAPDLGDADGTDGDAVDGDVPLVVGGQLGHVERGRNLVLALDVGLERACERAPAARLLGGLGAPRGSPPAPPARSAGPLGGGRPASAAAASAAAAASTPPEAPTRWRRWSP